MTLEYVPLHSSILSEDRLSRWLPFAGCLGAVVLLNALVQKVRLYISRRHLSIEYQCQPPPPLPDAQPLTLGIPKLKEAAEHVQDGSYLELTQNRFENASTYTSQNLGTTMIDTCDPRNIQTMLALKFADFEYGEQRRTAFSPLLGQGIFANDGHIWKHSRSMLRPGFTSDTIANLDVFEEYFQDLLHVVDAARLNEVDLNDLFSLLTLDTATHLFFGKSCRSLQERLRRDTHVVESETAVESFTDAFNRTQRKLADDLVLGRFSALLTSSKAKGQYKKDCEVVHDFVADAIHQHQETAATKSGVQHDKGTYILLRELVNREETCEEVIRNELINVLVGARDTTAALLGNLWFTLARNPSKYTKLRAEVLEKLGTSEDGSAVQDPPTLEDLQVMPYLHACIDEALRLFPPVPVNTRAAVNDTILPIGGGEDGEQPVLVPAGTRVGYNTYALHRRKDIWGPDADEFHPERWMKPDAAEHRTQWHYLPFSGGPRTCMGQRMALNEARFLTCRLIQHFAQVEAAADLELDPTPAELVTTVSSSFAEDGLKTRRKSQSSAVSGPACSWKWQESLTLTLSSRNGAHVRLLR